MSKAKLAILITNLGTPDAPTAPAIRRFLRVFLSDKRVVEVPRPIWWLILHGFILPFRPKPLSHAYQAIWQQFGDSPLRYYTQRQVQKLQAEIQHTTNDVLVDYVFTYGSPSIQQQLDRYRDKAEKIIILPLYPQYSCSTTAAIYDQVAQYNLQQRNIVDVSIIKDYYASKAYREVLAQSVRDFWLLYGRSQHLLVSNHGVPKLYADKGDPYYQQCLQTTYHLQTDLGLSDAELTSSFQSRLGKAEWLKPYTSDTVKKLAQQGIKTVDVICPSFSVDCLETLEEIAVENAAYFKAAGGETLRLIPCLNDQDAHIKMMLQLLQPYMPSVNQ